METKHTPTPWFKESYEKVNGGLQLQIWAKNYPDAEFPDDNLLIAELNSDYAEVPKEFEANWEYIVKAVNSHETTVNALKITVDQITENLEYSIKECGKAAIFYTFAQLQEIKAALKSAEGGGADA